MGRITQYRTDPDLCELLITRSFETMVWLRKKGVKFPGELRAPVAQDRQQVTSSGAGSPRKPGAAAQGLVENEHKACEREGIRIFYETPAIALITDDERRGMRRQGEAPGQKRRDPLARRWYSPAAASSRAPKCARVISARTGISPRCAARATTPGLGIKMALEIGAHALRPLVGLPRGGLGP